MGRNTFGTKMKKDKEVRLELNPFRKVLYVHSQKVPYLVNVEIAETIFGIRIKQPKGNIIFLPWIQVDWIEE